MAIVRCNFAYYEPSGQKRQLLMLVGVRLSLAVHFSARSSQSECRGKVRYVL